MLTLADRACTDVSVAGAKAAHLAQATRAGFPVLPGLVVPTTASRTPLADGYERVAIEGAHGARLAVMDCDTSIGDLAELPSLCGQLGNPLVVRSSSPWEGTGHWSGAFTSYLDVAPDHVLTAVRGVWASALGGDALERGAHVGSAGTTPEMAVLLQAQLSPDFAGTAAVEPDGTATVVAVAGSPVPLLHGWDPGWVSRVTGDGTVDGDRGALDDSLVRAIAGLVAAVARRLGDNRVEWAFVDERLVLLQCTTGVRATAAPVRKNDVPVDAVTVADEMLARAEAPASRARAEAYAYAAVMAHGKLMTGTPAAPGTGAGPVILVEGMPTDPRPLPPRAVLVAPRPLPHLAPLLWGASGLVTFGGSPGAHLVEVARALNLPAVVGCRSPEPLLRAVNGQGLAAVDGNEGVVSAWRR